MSKNPRMERWRQYEKDREFCVQDMANMIRQVAENEELSNEDAAERIRDLMGPMLWWNDLVNDGLRRAALDDFLEEL